MKIGKLPEPVLIRSVLKEVGHRREEVLVGPSVGQDCAVLEAGKGEVLVLSSDPITGTTKDIGSHSVYITANDLAASGAEPIGIMLTILLTPDTEEAELKDMMRGVEKTCKELNMEVMGGHTEITQVVRQPLISLTGVGKMKKEELLVTSAVKPGEDLVVTKWIGLEGTSIAAKEKEELISLTGVGKMKKEELLVTSAVKPGEDLVVTKWIGLEGTSIAAKEKEEVLFERFAPSFVETAKQFDKYLSVIPEAKIAKEWGASAMHDITEGGVFGALWEMGSGSGVGLDIDLKSIPIRQETVEVCEALGLNPYILMSSGSMLISTRDGHGLVQKLARAGIHAAVVGKATDGNDRILRNGEDTRYLDKPQSDELYKIYQ